MDQESGSEVKGHWSGVKVVSRVTGKMIFRGHESRVSCQGS